MTEIKGTSAPEDGALTIDGYWDFHYTYFAGAAASRFFAALKRGVLVGTRCAECGRVLVPARGFCDACFVATDDWVDVGTTGTLETFTILASSFPGLPEPPLVVGYVRLDGASSAVLNVVEGVDLSDLDRAGQQLLARPRVRTRFKDVCEGRITDFVFVVEDA